jgi:hypothetical protein
MRFRTTSLMCSSSEQAQILHAYISIRAVVAAFPCMAGTYRPTRWNFSDEV